MLKTVRPRFSKKKPLEEVLRRLHALFTSLPSIPPQPLQDALKALKMSFPSTQVSVPFCEPAPKADSNYKFGFESTKYYTAAAVVLYSILNGALNLWIWGKEKGTVYVGTAPSGERVSVYVCSGFPSYCLPCRTYS